MRKIIHLDMDCFYAAVEMRERPELGKAAHRSGRGQPARCRYDL
jgi:DNA polymerase-4